MTFCCLRVSCAVFLNSDCACTWELLFPAHISQSHHPFKTPNSLCLVCLCRAEPFRRTRTMNRARSSSFSLTCRSVTRRFAWSITPARSAKELRADPASPQTIAFCRWLTTSTALSRKTATRSFRFDSFICFFLVLTGQSGCNGRIWSSSCTGVTTPCSNCYSAKGKRCVSWFSFLFSTHITCVLFPCRRRVRPSARRHWRRNSRRRSTTSWKTCRRKTHIAFAAWSPTTSLRLWSLTRSLFYIRLVFVVKIRWIFPSLGFFF